MDRAAGCASAGGHRPDWEMIFTSQSTRWSGLTIEKGVRQRAQVPTDYDIAATRIGFIVANADLAWVGRGVRRRCQSRPGTCIFTKANYRIDQLYADVPDYSKVSAVLDDAKISDLLQDDLRYADVDFFEHAVTSDAQVVGMLQAMYAEARNGNPAGDLFAQSASVALLTHVLQRYDRAGAAKLRQGRLSVRQDAAVIRHIKDNLGARLSISDLADLAQLSPAYFCRAFAKTRGVTPHRFILNERVARARIRLQEPSAPSLAELAQELGFADPAHFSNVFRKAVGVSPSAFRKSATGA